MGQYDASQRPDNGVSHECHSVHCVVHQWCRLSDPVCLSAESHAHPSQVKLARLIACKNRKLLEDSRNSSVAQFAAISQVSTQNLCASGHCVGIRRAMALIGNARQAMSEGIKWSG